MDIVNNAWYPILDQTEFPRRNRIARLRRFATDMIVWQSETGITVQEDRCPHKGAPLSLGRVVGHRVVCPYHGMEFNGRGACRHVPQLEDQSRIPVNFGIKTYPTRIAHGLLWLWWGEEEPTSELPFFPEVADETKLTSPSILEYPVSFVRVMESHFDLYHADHLHKWPLRVGKLVRETKVETRGRYIRTENVYENAKGKRQAARATILFPALSLQEGGPNFTFKIVAAAAPIDEKRTWFFMRHYFHLFRLPVVGPILNALNNLNSLWRVMPDDARVQSRQLPETGGLGSDQLILEADRGILEYWRLLRRARREPQKVNSVNRHLPMAADAP